MGKRFSVQERAVVAGFGLLVLGVGGYQWQLALIVAGCLVGAAGLIGLRNRAGRKNP